MDFFEQQRRARRRTGWLVLSFFVAVFVVGLLVHIVMMSFFVFFDDVYQGPVWEGFWRHPSAGAFFCGSQALVALIVCLGSLLKIKELSEGGGEYVAEMLGGREISAFTLRFEEKQLLNVVEEMSIAAGIVVPAVYILEKEHRINTFAAGFDPDSAVIGVTRGALDYLTRDEMQALVAHEFSHILNGDMVLNMRMIGVLFGLSMISQFGLAMSLLHPDLHKPNLATFGSGEVNQHDASAVMVLYFHPALWINLIVGLFLTVLGAAGWILGSMIKAAIGRQREFLADAAAVQFTRNPEALKSAFLKIGCPNVGSLVYCAHAIEASHLFIGNIFGRSLRWNPFSAHPDWTSRIRRLDPDFKGVFPQTVVRIRRTGDAAIVGRPDEAMIDELLATTNPRLNRFVSRARMDQARERKIAAVILSGPVEAAEKTDSKSIEMPKCISEALKTPKGCCTLIYALLLDKDENVRKCQMEELGVLSRRIPGVYVDWIGEISEAISQDFSVERTMAKTPQARKLRSAFIRIRNTTLREGLPKIRELSKDAYADFRRICSHLTGDVNKINLFRYALFAAFRHELDEHFEYGMPKKPSAQYHSISAVDPELRLALSYLAYAGHADHDAATTAYRAGLESAKLPTDGLNGTLLPLADCSFRTLDEALRTMQAASPSIREKCLEAFRTTLWNDGKQTAREEEIFLAAEAMLRTETQNEG